MLFNLAHSLGFPHYELMLQTMTARQFEQLLHFIARRADKREEARIQAQESNLRSFFRRKHRKQQQKGSSG